MEKEQLYQTIEAYLDGELTGSERTAFERELAADQSLAREVQLHGKLQRRLGNSALLELRAKLEAIGKEFPKSSLDQPPGNQAGGSGGAPGGLPFWAWGLVFFLLIGGAVSWYLLSDGPETPRLPPAVEPSEMIAEPPEETTPAETPAAEPESTPPATTPEPQRPPATNARPQAFDTNRELELLIGEESPSRRYEFSDGTLEYYAQEGYLNFSSKLTTSRSVEEGFFLNLYTNQYPENRVLRAALTFSEVNPDAPIAFAARKDYMAAYSGEVALTPGLYYGVVTTGDSSIALWVGKVRVD